MATDLQVQLVLAAVGYPVTADGIKGPLTNEAILKALADPVDERMAFVIKARKGARVISGFGDRYVEGFGYGHHDGLDIGEQQGDPVEAAMAGEVVHARDGGDGYGISVVISHPRGYYTRYGHLSEAFIKKGAQVNKGQKIGKVGSTGKSTGPHLHFEIRHGGLWGEVVNPAGRVVLKTE